MVAPQRASCSPLPCTPPAAWARARSSAGLASRVSAIRQACGLLVTRPDGSRGLPFPLGICLTPKVPSPDQHLPHSLLPEEGTRAPPLPPGQLCTEHHLFLLLGRSLWTSSQARNTNSARWGASGTDPLTEPWAGKEELYDF